MMPGFLHRFNAELTHLVNVPTYVKKLAIKEFHFHSPPAQLNYAAWLGGEPMKIFFFVTKTFCFI